ncbi:hypothetical protein WN11_26765 (plasmid) [Klebsiella pneumoniae]|nr:hypothetical protein WN11_26765 [Klebsiella pneumoniae]
MYDRARRSLTTSSRLLQPGSSWDDWIVFHAGISTGSEQRAAENEQKKHEDIAFFQMDSLGSAMGYTV